MEQKLKARDIIPGWPRGRSTSRPYPPIIPDFWEQKRIEARWNLYPEPMGEKMVRCNYFNPAEFHP
jgi:hypothetical protein